jgi:hypothetical protein
MSRISAEPTLTQRPDYSSMTAIDEGDELSLATAEHSKTAGDRLHRQMRDTQQNFQEFLNGVDESTRSESLGKSLVGAEAVKKSLTPIANEPNVDMSSLMLEMNKLLSKMRDIQRDHAIQQQQQALTMQMNAYKSDQASIDKSQSAASTNMIAGMVGGGLGGVGSIAKLGGVVGGAMGKSGALLKLAESGGEVLGQAAPAIATPVGQASSMSDTSASSQAKVEADRDKGLQGLNEREQGLRDDQSRTASQQMRDVQREMNELYTKIATAVRW